MNGNHVLPRDKGAAPLDFVIAVMAFLAALALGASLIADRAAQGCHQEQRNLVSVVDLGQRIDHRHEARGAHQRRRSHRAHIGAGAQPDRGFFAVDRNVGEAVVVLDGLDHVHQPVVGQAGDKFDAARRQLVGNARGDFCGFLSHAAGSLARI
jgi:hypothetical protein